MRIIHSVYTSRAEACAAGIRIASDEPGRYGGRYIARRSRKVAGEWRDEHAVLCDDDPALVRTRAGRVWDVYAVAHPRGITPLGAARYWSWDDIALAPARVEAPADA